METMTNMMTAGNGYPFEQWQINNAAAYQAFGVYPAYDFTRSPNTSSGSDDSMNTKPDFKKSPKYLEKRAKNNEAAKKSRLQRKKREQENVNENSMLKDNLRREEEKNKALVVEIGNMKAIIERLSMENSELKRHLIALEGNPLPNGGPLGDVTNYPRYQNM